MGLFDARRDRLFALATIAGVLGGVMGGRAIAQDRLLVADGLPLGQLGTVKVRVPREALAPATGRLVADYGAFAEYEVQAMAAAAAGAEVVEGENSVLLNTGALDTTQPAVRALRVPHAGFAGKAMHLVQFAGPIKREWYDRLERTGVQIVTYIPSNAYLVYGDAASIGALQAWGAADAVVQWDGEYLPQYRVDPVAAKMMNDPAKGVAKDQFFAIQLVKDDAANRATLAQIDAIRSGPVENDWEILNYRNVIAPIPPTLLAAIMTMPDVVSIQPWEPKHHFCERQDQIIAGNLTGNVPTGAGYLAWLGTQGFTQAQFTASNFVVDVSDSGVDNGTTTPNHFGLFNTGTFASGSRVAYNRLVGTAHSGSTLSGCDGHGNLNAHIIGGYDNTSGTPFADSSGYHYGLGVCPFVKVGSSVIFDPNTFTSPNYPLLQSQAYASGARVSSNSWGGNSNGYSVDSQSYDALVRDAQSGTTGNQEMVIVFAAGNNGSAANTVSEPSTAKNVITVGAGENVQAISGTDASGINDTGANNANDMATFSGRGPTSDGRKKPDIVAPGTHVSGGVAQASQVATGTGAKLSCYTGSGVSGGASSIYFPSSGQQFYTASSGTSHSTPCVSGACALVRQYFINQGWTAPSPAMTKAVLMNSARYMNGTGANDTLWSNAQGMGEVNLGEAFKRSASNAILRDELAADLFSATGQARTFTGNIADAAKPFRVTLAWTDAPGATSGSAFKNNLDLTVTIGANTYKGNVFTGASSTTGGSADTANNVESVFLPAGTSGAFTVTVTATNINSDGVPGNGDTTDQDFALVVYNATTGCASPTVAGNSSPQVVCAGSGVTFSVTATGTSLTYQWRKNTLDISGATGASYTIAATATGDAGSYDCVVGSSCGSITSSAAALTVNDVTAITGQSTGQAACAGGSASFSVSAVGTSLAYQWRKNTNPINGATAATLNISPVATSDAGSYDCVVTGSCGTATSAAVALSVPPNTSISQNPASQTVCVGANVTFTVAAGGNNLAYVWRKNGSPISGATSASYTINGVTLDDMANYYCQVNGDCGQAFSSLANLSVDEPVAVNPGGQPVSQTVCASSAVSLAVDGGGSINSYQWRKGGVPIGGATDSVFTIPAAATGDSGSYDCVLTGSCNTATSAAASVVVHAATAIAPGGQPQSQAACAGASVSLTVAAVGDGLGYQWRKGGQAIGGATLATFTMPSVQSGDESGYDCVVTGSCGGPVTSASATVTITSATAINSQPSAVSACVGGTASFSVGASGSGLTYQWRRGGTPLGGATSPTFTISPAAQNDVGTYDCVVTGACGTATSTGVALTVDDSLAINGQPSSQDLCEGGAISLSIGVTGGATGYQWRKDTTPIGGATAPTLSISPAAATDSGTYDCVATGSCGSVTSQAATVNVCGHVEIGGQSGGMVICPGGSASLSVTAAGGGLTFQWRKGGVAVSGATASTIDFTPAANGQSGVYDCVVTNCCDSATSAPVRFNVCAADFNCNGTVQVQDIFDFLNAWFSGAPAADFNGGGLAVQDIFDFLTAWFGGCP